MLFRSIRPLTRLAVLLDTTTGDHGVLSALERSDLEDEVEETLAELGIDQPWALTAGLVDGGMTPDNVRGVADDFGAELAATVLRACDAAHAAHALLDEVEEGARRLSDIVGALKSYSYLDQAPIQEVDVAKGLEDTLLILKSELGDIEVRREYANDLPSIEAFGSELNQVWTNLIDNAADAINEDGGSTITLRTSPAAEFVVVEVEDDGPGIPADVQSRVFDAFFTTKPPGSGTGLGLDISYGIVVHKHRGDISVQSEPGRTVFRVELPIVQSHSSER